MTVVLKSLHQNVSVLNLRVTDASTYEIFQDNELPVLLIFVTSISSISIPTTYLAHNFESYKKETIVIVVYFN